MARTTVYVGDQTYEGVLLPDLLRRAGLLAKYIVVTAKDGYRVVFSLAEIDPDFGELQALLADRVGGKPLGGTAGVLTLVIPRDKKEARWVRMIERIEVPNAP